MEMKYRMDDFLTLMVRRQEEFVAKMEKAQKDKTDKADHDAILMETERSVRLTTLFISTDFKFCVLILAFCCQHPIESHEETTISKHSPIDGWKRLQLTPLTLRMNEWMINF